MMQRVTTFDHPPTAHVRRHGPFGYQDYESYRDFEHLPANTLASIPEGQSTRSIATRRLADTIERLNTGQTRRR